MLFLYVSGYVEVLLVVWLCACGLDVLWIHKGSLCQRDSVTIRGIQLHIFVDSPGNHHISPTIAGTNLSR